MKTTLFFLLLVSYLSASAQTDSLNWRHKPYQHKREHFLFIGGNVSYLMVKNNPSGYEESPGSGSYNEYVTNLQQGLPGFQINCITFHQLSPSISYYNGVGYSFYHSQFNYNLYHSSHYGPLYAEGYPIEADSTITYMNSEAFYFHYIFGLRITLPCNFYIKFDIEPYVIIYTNQQSDKYFSSSYDSTGNIISRYDSTGKNGNTISALNINTTIGVGYRLFASKPHPVCIEFNYSPDIFNSTILFGLDNLGDMALHRYSFELNIGYKF